MMRRSRIHPGSGPPIAPIPTRGVPLLRDKDYVDYTAACPSCGEDATYRTNHVSHWSSTGGSAMNIEVRVDCPCRPENFRPKRGRHDGADSILF